MPNNTAEQISIERDLTDRVVSSFEGTDDPRLRELLGALVEHAHAFVRETRLTEAEWTKAIEFLTAVGDITDDKRQEFILLSDVLGVSMQTIAVSNPAVHNATEATVFGPFFLDDAPEVPIGGDITHGAAGELCWFEGTITDTDGNLVPRARIEVWECDEDGLYDVQYGDERMAGRSYLYSNDHGEYSFWGLKPVPDTRRRPGRFAAVGDEAIPTTGGSRALHGQCASPADTGHSHIRRGRSADHDRRQRFRGQGFTDQDVRAARCRRGYARRSQSGPGSMVQHSLRHCVGTERHCRRHCTEVIRFGQPTDTCTTNVISWHRETDIECTIAPCGT